MTHLFPSLSGYIKSHGAMGKIHSNVSLAPYTSYKVGGKAQWYATPHNWQELQAIFEWFSSKNLSLTLLGAGSNLLISDKGIEGLVLSTRNFRHYQFNEETGCVTVAAGRPIVSVAWQAAKKGWLGLEWAVGIPGTVGGAVVMNAGAHNKCIADLLVNVVVLSYDGKIKTLTPEDLNYNYRTSFLQNGKYLVLEATLQLQQGFTREEITKKTQENLQKRKSSQPYDKPSCGSVFRNPSSYSAGWLIEQLGLKGHRVGDAEISHCHANFILNCGHAKAEDIFYLIRYVQQKVQDHWSLLLEPEVKILGEFSTF